MKLIFSTILLNLFLVSNLFAQNKTYAIHITNPLGMFQKAGLKLEVRQKQNSLLLSGTQYYGSLPKYPGTQVGLVGRHYSTFDSTTTHENFLYSKLLYGYQQHVNQSGTGFFNRAEVLAGNYYAGGIGLGSKYHFGRFFLDINVGLKYTLSEVNHATAFYIMGPGSYLDLHFNFGIQL